VFGLSFWEIAIILVIALVVLGPSKLPELAKSLGKGIREFRRATEDFKSTVEDEMHRPEPLRAPRSPEARLEEGRAELIPAPQTVERGKLTGEDEPVPADPAGRDR
jgi:TatA/E family protein of Tat protein translocase